MTARGRIESLIGNYFLFMSRVSCVTFSRVCVLQCGLIKLCSASSVKFEGLPIFKQHQFLRFKCNVSVHWKKEFGIDRWNPIKQGECNKHGSGFKLI
jgi:pantothenate kinase type III